MALWRLWEKGNDTGFRWEPMALVYDNKEEAYDEVRRLYDSVEYDRVTWGYYDPAYTLRVRPVGLQELADLVYDFMGMEKTTIIRARVRGMVLTASGLGKLYDVVETVGKDCPYRGRLLAEIKERWKAVAV